MAAGMQNLIPFPFPQGHEVHIHLAYLDSEAVRYISREERLRADQLLDLQKRHSFMIGRGLLREILCRYLGKQPEQLDLAAGDHGKPFLSGSSEHNARLHFNLSHSGRLFLLAVAADREVGIDLEQLHNDTPFAAMARLSFSPLEQNDLFCLPDHQQRNAFYRCWTRKEAYLKACGTGFSVPSNSFSVTLLPNSSPSLYGPTSSPAWILQDITAPDGYCAALAVKGAKPIISYLY